MSGFWESNKVPLSIIIGSIIIGFFIYFSPSFTFFSKKDQPSPSPTTIVQAPTATPIQPTPTEQPVASTLTPIPKPTDEEQIKKALITKTGISEQDLEYSISFNDGKLARGSVKNKNEMGGAGWFAGRDATGNWVVAYVGQGVPPCADIAPFNFPKSWISHCVDKNGNTVAR